MRKTAEELLMPSTARNSPETIRSDKLNLRKASLETAFKFSINLLSS